ncbi:hypothetical protein Tco_0738686 [Tanacetum coccineum]
MCYILRSFENLDEKIELQCLYLEKYQECEDLKTELSKQNENVENKSFNELSKKFAEIERHCISLKLSLHHKNKVCQVNRPYKNQDAPEFPNFFEINELKAQLQDKNTVICELKKLNAKLKGKSVDTKFDKPSVVRQSNAFKFQKSSVLGKAKRSTFKTKTNPSSKGRLNLLHVDLYGPMRNERINGKKYILNGIVERQNHALVEAARIMLSASKLSLFFWAEVIATSKGYRVYNKRTKLIVGSIHINFDKIKEMTMTSDDNTSGLAPQRKMASDYDNFVPGPQLQNPSSERHDMKIEIQDHNNEPLSSKLVPIFYPPSDTNALLQQELDLLFTPLFEEYFTTGNQSVSKSFDRFDNSQQQDTQPTLNVQPTLKPTTPPTNVNAKENNTNQEEDAQFEAYEFINPFCTPVQEVPESSS